MTDETSSETGTETDHDSLDEDTLTQIARIYQEPERAGKTADLAALVAQADAEDYVNAAVFGRLCLAMRAHEDRDLATCAASFAWCEQRWTERADELLDITVEMLLAMYVILIHNVRQQPQIPFAQVDRFVEAMTSRYRQYGRSMRAPYQQAYLSALLRDDLPTAEQYFRWWQATPKDEWAHIDSSFAMGWLARNQQWDEVVAQYRAGLPEILERRWMAELLHAGVLEALVRLGRLDAAQAAHQAGMDAINHDDPELEAIGQHLVYCAMVGELDTGIAILGEFLPYLDGRPPGLRVEFCESAVVLLTRLHEAGRDDETIPSGHTVADLRATMRAEAVAYARTVNEVNGITAGTDRLTDWWSKHGV